MYTKWTSHLKNEHEKAQFEEDLRRAKPVLERLRTILEQNILELKNNSKNIQSFESPSWPFMQAFAVGVESSLFDVVKLIDLDKQKDKTNG